MTIPLYHTTLLIWFIMMVIGVDAQLNCSNYYSTNNLPSQCDSNNTCIFPTFTNTSLIINITADNQYVLCIDLPSYSMIV